MRYANALRLFSTSQTSKRSEISTSAFHLQARRHLILQHNAVAFGDFA
jgi:hypothetical protein